MVYSLPHLVPLTYLPAMWLAYVPAVLLHFDLRWIHVCAIVASIWILYAASDHKELAASLGGVFLLVPYLLYRHEIYLGILWLALSLVYFFGNRRRPIMAAIFIGVAAATSQFAWVVAPFYFLALFRKSGWKRLSAGVALAVLSFAIIVLPFVIQRPVNFYEGVFAHWSYTFNATTLNLSYFLTRAFSLPALKYFQAIATAIAMFFAVKTRREYAWMTFALLFFILLNPVIWVYFYLTVFLLMLAAETQRQLNAFGS
jgi:uncharacterized membrane protein